MALSHSTLNWTLALVTGKYRELDQNITEENQKILDSGSYTDPETGKATNFSLPSVD